MLLSHAVKGKQPHGSNLKYLDLFYAVLLHVLVFTIIGVMTFWQQQHQPEPLKRIEVMMISAQDLAKLERQAQPKIKTKPAKVTKIKTPQQKKKIVKKVKQTKPKPKKTTKLKPIKKAIVKSNPIKKPVKVDENFDPFAPVTSTTDVKSVPKKASTSQPELANLAGKQLSRNEKEHYIALMQAAVQQHWKIAASTANFTDPLVEMQLMPSGEIASVHILESSGNASLDASLIRAIKAAAPFELPRQQFEFFRVNRIRFHPLK